MKLRIGIIFGGQSREREISFAGGRTIYDNLNKTLFDAVPIFVDSFGNFVLLDWNNIYKGSIRDFYPPINFLSELPSNYQVYSESLGDLTHDQQLDLIKKIGKNINPTELSSIIDFAFLCLHGNFGEDGRMQGLLEYLNIPYSGSGILSSAIGINKAIQKKLMKDSGFPGPSFVTFKRNEWKNENETDIFQKINKEVGFPCVIKPAHQGSSIGVSVVEKNDETILKRTIDKAFFIRKINKKEWNSLKQEDKEAFVRSLTDIRESLGLPVYLSAVTSTTSTSSVSKISSSAEKNSVNTEKVFHPTILLSKIDEQFKKGVEELILESADGESEIVVEKFIEGKEFSCIVIRNEPFDSAQGKPFDAAQGRPFDSAQGKTFDSAQGPPVALPPTEIRKGKELFDYRSKYLPGLSRKITPVELPYEDIQHIRQECEKLFLQFNFNVYARIDGFISKDGKIFLNDPNTTSGMLPSSFFFHQAAEIGLNPSQFLTYIIRMSLYERLSDMHDRYNINNLLNSLDESIHSLKKISGKKIRVAVIMGGYSSERHISVESGRNVYEKLSSSEKYLPIPVFLTGDNENHTLYQLPVNLMLKDNADDIREKVNHYSQHEVIKEIMMLCENITSKYTSSNDVLVPKQISYDELSDLVDVAFIALHGRPGEDGAIQKHLEKLNIPYNGSGVQSSSITINKYETNEILKKHGFSVASHRLVSKEEWGENQAKTLAEIQKYYSYPFIAKPVDDGCSSAVKKIRNEKELIAFAESIFRTTIELEKSSADILNLKPKEEFPIKKQFLIEELITKEDAEHFLEITGGMLTRTNEKGECIFEIFEASEALSGGDVLSLEEKFLAGEGQNITPARYSIDGEERQRISDIIKNDFSRAARLLNIEGYARIDAFVRIFKDGRVETIFIEVNSLPGMTPATCIFHQSALANYKPYEYIDAILEYGMKKKKHPVNIH